MSNLKIHVVSGVTCPKCGAPELNPAFERFGEPGSCLIRAFKVVDEHGSWSQCLVCAGCYDHVLDDNFRFQYVLNGKNSDPSKGWFCTKF